MSNVVDLASFRCEPVETETETTVSGPAKCAACGKCWVATAPGGVVALECPACHSMRGVFVWPVQPPDGELIWICDCGGDLFVLRPHGPWCVRCATWVKGWT